MKAKKLHSTLIVIVLLLAGAPTKLIAQSVFTGPNPMLTGLPVFIGPQPTLTGLPLTIDLHTFPSTLTASNVLADVFTIDVCSNKFTGDTEIFLSCDRWLPAVHVAEGIHIANTRAGHKSVQNVTVFGPGLNPADVGKHLDLTNDIFLSITLCYLDPVVLDACIARIKAFNLNSQQHTPLDCTELLASVLSAVGFKLQAVRHNETPSEWNEVFQKGLLGKGVPLQDGREVKSIKAEYRQGLPTQIRTNLPASYVYIGHLRHGQPTGIGRATFGGGPSTYVGSFNGAKIDGDGTLYGIESFAMSHFIGYLAYGPTTITYFVSANSAVQTGMMMDGQFRGRVDTTEKSGRKLWFTVDANGISHADLVRVTLNTTTHGQDRDHDTGLWVEVSDQKNNFIAKMKSGEIGGKYGYAKWETHAVNIPIVGSPQESQCDGFRYRIGIQAGGGFLGAHFNGATINGIPVIPPSGNDDWTFSAWLILDFSDGDTVIAEKDNQDLNSTGGQLAWGPYSGATMGPYFNP